IRATMAMAARAMMASTVIGLLRGHLLALRLPPAPPQVDRDQPGSHPDMHPPGIRVNPDQERLSTAAATGLSPLVSSSVWCRVPGLSSRAAMTAATSA